MSEPTEEEIQNWMNATAEFGDSQQIRQQVIRAGKFFTEIGQLSGEVIEEYLSTIDFSMSLTVVRLPNSVFVQFPEEKYRYWFTDTGYSAEPFASASRIRKRKLFKPRMTIPALKVTAIDMEDRYSLQEIFLNLPPTIKEKFGDPSRGAGNQYLILNQNSLREI